MTSTERKSVSVRVSGKVHGVWFRAWTRERALALGLDGWVRNRRDGSVEAVFSGPPEAVDRMIAECHKGPSAARVDAVDVSDAPAGEIASGFAQRDTH